MANFSFQVDTSPMAGSINRVSNHVDAVTGAVTVMQAAVIRQEVVGTKQVCTSIDQGFYHLIRSQISQKLARLRSDVDARLLALRQLGVALAGVQRQMESDYQMIASRYAKLFGALDKTVRARVFDLDKTPAELGSRVLPRLLERLADSGAQYLVSGSEAIPATQYAAASKIRGNTGKVIASIRNSLFDAVRLKKDMQSVVLDQQLDTRSTRYLPFLLLEGDPLHPPGTIVSVVCPSLHDLQLRGARDVERRIRDSYAALPWTPASEADHNAVTSAFDRLVESRNLDSRLRDEMRRLQRANSWNKPAGGAA